jgi:hypothetical protein
MKLITLVLCSSEGPGPMDLSSREPWFAAPDVFAFFCVLPGS